MRRSWRCHAARHREAAQIGGVEPGVEMEGIGEVGKHVARVGVRALELVPVGRDDRQAVVRDLARRPGSIARRRRQ
jgi:hypothetical protein